MSLTKKNITGFIVGAAAIALGIVILLHADKFIVVLMVGAGIAALANGISTLVAVGEWKFNDNVKRLTIIKGILVSAVGLASIIAPWFAAATVITVIAIIFGVVLIFSGAIALNDAFVIRKTNSQADITRFVVEGAIDILLAVILVANPAGILIVFAKIIGIAAIVLGAVLVLMGVRLLSSGKKADATIEVEVVEEK